MAEAKEQTNWDGDWNGDWYQNSWRKPATQDNIPLQQHSLALTDEPSCEGTWNWNEWKDEEVWGGDWYDKSWRDPAPSKLQSNQLSWREDGHPVTTSTSSQTGIEKDETTQQELGNSTSTSTRPRRPGGREAYGPRLWCHIFLNKRHDDFDLVPILIGRGGKNTQEISDLTQSKVRARGRGSGHKEVHFNKKRLD